MFRTMARVFGCGLLVSLVAAACSDDESPANGGGGRGGSGGSSAGTGGKGGSGGSAGGGTAGVGGSGDAAVDAGLARFKGTVLVAVPGNLGKGEAPLPGVEVCVVDANGVKNASFPCATTNAMGEYALNDLAPNQDLIFMFSKSGYASQLVAADIAAGGDIQRVPVRMAEVQSDAGEGGVPRNFGTDPAVTQDPSKGTVNVFAVQSSSSPDSGAAAPGFDFTTGVSFSVTPTGGNGPYYVNPDETWASAATATVNGYGAWFMNLTPGTVTFTATHPTLRCNAAAGNGYGWAQTDGSNKAPVIAGLNTQAVGFFCAPPPADAATD